MSGFLHVSFQTNSGSRAASHPVERGQVGTVGEQSTEGSSLQTSNGTYICMSIRLCLHTGVFVLIHMYVRSYVLLCVYVYVCIECIKVYTHVHTNDICTHCF